MITWFDHLNYLETYLLAAFVLLVLVVGPAILASMVRGQ